MLHLLNLLAAIALLVWGTQFVRTGVLRLLGENLGRVLRAGMGNRFRALLSGAAVASLVQSSTATCLLVASFLGRNIVPTAAALAAVLGADVGTALVALLLSFDLSWLSPLLIFAGVVMFATNEKGTVGRSGRVLLGLGLIMLALQLVVEATRPLVQSEVVRALLAALPNEVLLDLVVGMLLTVLAYSSLAIVLLVATLAASGLVPPGVALGLVLGANIGSALLAVASTLRASAVTRRLPLGNLLFKLAACALAIPLLPYVVTLLPAIALSVQQQVVAFHLLFNIAMALLFLGVTGPLARALERWLVDPTPPAGLARPQHLDPMAIATPSLAISCAAREALHQADVVETMLRGIAPVIRHNDRALAEQLRALDDTVDQLYTAIKLYLTKISRESLSERESRRWTDIMSFTINMEQIGDIIERVLQDVEDKKIRKSRRFSDAGMAEIVELHERLIANLRLGMSVFLDGHVRDARRLLEEKARFRDLEHEYAATHIARLQDNTPEAIETSSLHLDLISDLKRINSHICSIAYPILEQAGALAATRIRASKLLTSEDEAR
jgi:phosphate:Na+ symporter